MAAGVTGQAPESKSLYESCKGCIGVPSLSLKNAAKAAALTALAVAVIGALISFGPAAIGASLGATTSMGHYISAAGLAGFAMVGLAQVAVKCNPCAKAAAPEGTEGTSAPKGTKAPEGAESEHIA